MRTQFAFALCLMASGCQNSPSGTDASVDASVDEIGDVTADAPQDSGTDTGSTACNALTNVGPVVQQMYVASNPVTGDGGVIATGTYVLTGATVYSGPDGGVGATGTTYADTLAMSDGGTYERAATVVDDPALEPLYYRQNGRITSDGGSLQVTQTCPAGRQPFTSYDSDGTRLRIYAPAGALGPGVMFEYTRQ